MIHLILGGARSGKSSFAEQWCLAQAKKTGTATTPATTKEPQFSYVATATAFDGEMNERITQHQKDRDGRWQLVECPLALPALITHCAENNIYLVDCLTLWLNNLIYAFEETITPADAKQKLQQHIDQLISALSKYITDKNVNIVLVANEVGLGIVPLGSINRLYVDHAGWLNQAIAKIANQVTLVTAGIPLVLKNTHGHSSFSNNNEQASCSCKVKL